MVQLNWSNALVVDRVEMLQVGGGGGGGGGSLRGWARERENLRQVVSCMHMLVGAVLQQQGTHV